MLITFGSLRVNTVRSSIYPQFKQAIPYAETYCQNHIFSAELNILLIHCFTGLISSTLSKSTLPL